MQTIYVSSVKHLHVEPTTRQTLNLRNLGRSNVKLGNFYILQHETAGTTPLGCTQIHVRALSRLYFVQLTVYCGIDLFCNMENYKALCIAMFLVIFNQIYISRHEKFHGQLLNKLAPNPKQLPLYDPFSPGFVMKLYWVNNGL